MHIKTKYQTWIKKNCTIINNKQLTLHNVFVFLYQYGILYIVLMALTFITGINYGNNLVLAFCFLISAVFVLSFYLTFKQLYGLNIDIIPPTVGSVGHVFFIELVFKQEIANHRHIYIEYLLGDKQEKLPILINQKEQKIKLPFIAYKRGKFELPIIKLSSVYPFGLIRTWTYLYYGNDIWIAPKAMKNKNDNKNAQTDFVPDVDEFRELRSFQEGDSYQSVSWKQLARGQGLFVKVFEQLNDDHKIAIRYDEIVSNNHEDKLSLMMGLIDNCHHQNISYSVHLPHDELAYNQGEKQYLSAKLLLAKA